MTYNDLKKEVAALGFESEAPDEIVMLSAANRALRRIFNERECKKRAEFYKPKIHPSFTAADFLHTGGGEEVFQIYAKAISFTTSGSGSCIIKDSSGEREISFQSPLSEHREFIIGNAEIVFLGDYSYSVIGFAAWDEIFGAQKKDIPLFAKEISYEIKEHFKDYQSPLTPPLDKDENQIPGSKISGEILTLPRDYFGAVRFYYKASPSILSGIDEETITLPDGCEHLLALLAASYAWLDDDAEKSQYYAALYREEMASLKIYSRTGLDTQYKNINGWA